MECIPGRLKGEGWKGVHGESYTRVYIAGVQECLPEYLQECVALYTRLKIRESLPVYSIRRRELVMMPEARSFVTRHRKGLHNSSLLNIAPTQFAMSGFFASPIHKKNEKEKFLVSRKITGTNSRWPCAKDKTFRTYCLGQCLDIEKDKFLFFTKNHLNEIEFSSSLNPEIVFVPSSTPGVLLVCCS